jgi:SAM-dependent methyltransferase
MNTLVSQETTEYYGGQYWNSFPRTIEYMSENFTGDKNKWWLQDFKERFCGIPFEHGLVFNCGNGWVERLLIDQGIVKRVTSFDYSYNLLSEAIKEKGDRNIHYFQADVNRVDFKDDIFDLVVNVAALHHVQFINRFCLILCRALTESGIFLNFDYIGPHRNQYSFLHWFYLKKVNRSLPKHIRKEPLIRPHLPTMIHMDATEAIHSDLIIETIQRYFDIFERHDTAGGIAYEILTHNKKLNKISDIELDMYIENILLLDKTYTESKKVPPLFSYFLAKPQKGLLEAKSKISMFQIEEDQRERKAKSRKWVYSNWDYAKMVFHSIYVKYMHCKAVNYLRRVKHLMFR